MIDTKTSKALVIAYALWAVTALLLAQGWVLLALDYWRPAVMMGLTGCAMSAVAAVAHIRSFSIRVLTVIRRLHGIDGDHEPQGLRRVP